MSEMILVEIALAVFGAFFGFLSFSVIILPVFYGVPRAIYWAARGRAKWYSPIRYVVWLILWMAIFFALGFVLVNFFPNVADYLYRSEGVAWGQLIGIVFGIGRSVFSRSGRHDLHHDFVSFMQPYLTAKGAAVAGFADDAASLAKPKKQVRVRSGTYTLFKHYLWRLRGTTYLIQRLMPLAEQGDPEAQLTLGMYFIAGKGVWKDYVAAYKWVALASERGGVWDERCRNFIEELERRMAPAQIVEAQRLAREWKPKKE